MRQAQSRYFCFDLGSPLCYLAAERISHTVPGPVPWLPVSAEALPAAQRFDAFRCESELAAFKEDVERRAAKLGLPSLRWPHPFPFDSGLAMRVATYATSIGRAVPFAQAAFRQAFAGGHALDAEDYVLIAAAACEMHPQAVLKGAGGALVARALKEAGESAHAAGVSDLPAVVIDGEAFVGERSLEAAAARASKAQASHDSASGSSGTGAVRVDIVEGAT